jgi:hypothetical protein
MTSDRNPKSQRSKIGGKILATTVSLGALLCLLGIVMFLTSCSQAASEASSRIFNKVSIEYIGEYQLPNDFKVKDTLVGGLSGLTYDRQREVFYAVSDDRGEKAPARFYTLKLDLDTTNPQQVKFNKVKISDVTLLKQATGATYPPVKPTPKPSPRPHKARYLSPARATGSKIFPPLSTNLTSKPDASNKPYPFLCVIFPIQKVNGAFKIISLLKG